MLMSIRVIESTIELLFSSALDNVVGIAAERELTARRLKQLLDNDLETCSNCLHNEANQAMLGPLSRDVQNENVRRWDKNNLQDAMHVAKTIPHLAIRIALIFDRLAAKTPAGSPLRLLREQLLGFAFCQSLAGTLLHVVGRSRTLIAAERPTFIFVDKRRQHRAEQHDRGSTANMLIDEEVFDFENFEPELDHINKESIMTGLKFLAKRTHTFPDEEACLIIESLQWLPAAIMQHRASDYVSEEAVELTSIIVLQEPGQQRSLQADKQTSMVKRILERLVDPAERRDRRRDPPSKARLHNKLFESCLMYLERQKSMSTEALKWLMEQLLLASRGRSVALKQRLFAVFEKHMGQSMFAKLKFFFSGHVGDNTSRMVQLLVIS